MAAPAPDEWPVVTVQLPVYNEVYVVERLIDACVRLDYPPEALEIQVLDDSTDETAELVAALCAHWQRLGIDIRHIRRDRRTGFKAGALAEGMASARGTLIAIFDADFVPPPDFLTAAVPVLAADPGLAFVQARWGYVNRDDLLLTSLQALSRRRPLRGGAAGAGSRRLLVQLQRDGRDLAARSDRRCRRLA